MCSLEARGIRSFAVVVTDNCESLKVGAKNKTWSFAREVWALNH